MRNEESRTRQGHSFRVAGPSDTILAATIAPETVNTHEENSVSLTYPVPQTHLLNNCAHVVGGIPVRQLEKL